MLSAERNYSNVQQVRDFIIIFFTANVAEGERQHLTTFKNVNAVADHQKVVSSACIFIKFYTTT